MSPLLRAVTAPPASTDDRPTAGDEPPDSGDDCPACGAALVFHQPDEEAPERLLGTCVGCKGWFLLDGVRGGGVTLLVPGGAPAPRRERGRRR
jgi:hypothetical protein